MGTEEAPQQGILSSVQRLALLAAYDWHLLISSRSTAPQNPQNPPSNQLPGPSLVSARRRTCCIDRGMW